ncbi:MAG TPA: IS110 family transposase [Thermoanaerobaculia bacterium]|nr:IS110 family transposase [Thermoanaerobaculia bacterium]
MFAGIDIASERHVLARLDAEGKPIGRPIGIAEDQAGYAKLIEALGPPPVLIVLEATGHYWKNLYAMLTAAGHDVALLNPFIARRFQEASLERTKTDAIDAEGLARLAFEKRPVPTRLHEEAAESLRELVRHRDRLRQDFDDRVRQLHRLVDLGFPELTRYVRSLDRQLATALIAEYPTAQAFARANPRRLAKLRYDGRHFVGPELADQLVAAAKRSVGQHHGPVYALQARHLCQDLDLWRRRLAEIERDIEGLLDAHEVGKLLLSIDGIGPHSAARIIAAVGDPARFRSAGAFAAYVGVVPGLRQSGKQSGRIRAPIAPMGNARLRRALWMPVLGAVRRNLWLRAFYERLRAAGKPPKLALVAALRKLLHAVYSVAKNRRPFRIETERARAA